MVTTEELIKMAEKESKEIGEAEEEIKQAEDLAIKKWKVKIAKERAEKIVKNKKIKARYQTTRKLGTLKSGKIGKRITKVLKKQIRGVKTKYKKSVKPVKRRKRPMPPQLKQYLTRKKQIQQTQIVRTPSSVRDLQNMRTIRHLLTQQEQQVVDRLYSGARRAAAIQMIKRKMKDNQVAHERANPQVVYRKDIMTGRTIIDRKVPRERWVM